MDEELFGRIAIERAYIISDDLERALQIQRDIQEQRNTRKLLGIIMLESGMISSDQLLEILRHIEERQNTRYF